MPGGLTEKEVNVSDISGKRHSATLLICPDCKGEAFVVYTVKGHDHPHLQCARCGVSYCTSDRPACGGYDE